MSNVSCLARHLLKNASGDLDTVLRFPGNRGCSVPSNLPP